MMSRNKIFNITLSFILILQAAFFQIALPNLILCFGSDGHITFEWQSEEKLCDHENLVDSAMFSNSEKEFTGTPEADCTDIDLHFHPSFANKTQKKNNSLFVTKTFGQHNLWTTEKNNKYVTINLHHIIPSNPKIEAVQNTVLII